MTTGQLLKGTDNSHWYKIGMPYCSSSTSQDKTVDAFKLISFNHDISHHPDDPSILITTNQLPDMQRMIDLCVNGHLKLFPDVPLAGWDVAMTNNGIMVLEANLSCNFFRGTFDRDKYFGFVNDCFENLSANMK